MSVRDVTTLATKIAPIVNADIADSQTTANAWCAQHGVPFSNQFVYNLGTKIVLAHAGDRYAGFWTDLYNHVMSIGAYGVFCAAGCPMGIELLDINGSQNGNAANFPLLVGFVKRIHADGHEPRSVGPYQPMKYGSGDWSLSLPDTSSDGYYKATQTANSAYVSQALEKVADADYTTAIGATSGYVNYFSKYKSGWGGDYSIMDNLLTGIIGYPSDVTDHATDIISGLWNLSRPILGKAANTEGRIASLSGRTVMVCLRDLDAQPNGYGPAAKWALIGKKLADMGLTVKFYYEDGAAPTYDLVAEAMLVPGGANDMRASGWTDATLSNQTASPTVTYRYGFGAGFYNDKQLSPDDWDLTMIPSTSGGIWMGGASSDGGWAKSAIIGGGFSVIHHQGTGNLGWHQGAREQSKGVDAALALLAGRTLAEAAWVTNEYTQLAIGDPLMRPFQ